jgi:hypothetical protein
MDVKEINRMVDRWLRIEAPEMNFLIVVTTITFRKQKE